MAAVLLGISLLAFSQDDGGQVFKDGALRIDYLMGGTASTTEVFMEQVKKEPFYGGSRVNLIDGDDYGTFRYRMYHSQTGKLIFSKGFCSLFQEWQTTTESHSVKRSFYQVAILPYPAVRVRFTIERKTRDGHEEQLLSMEIDPDDYFIVNDDLGLAAEQLRQIILSEWSRVSRIDMKQLSKLWEGGPSIETSK